jgi:hypothetical protein
MNSIYILNWQMNAAAMNQFSESRFALDFTFYGFMFIALLEETKAILLWTKISRTYGISIYWMYSSVER